MVHRCFGSREGILPKGMHTGTHGLFLCMPPCYAVQASSAGAHQAGCSGPCQRIQRAASSRKHGEPLPLIMYMLCMLLSKEKQVPRPASASWLPVLLMTRLALWPHAPQVVTTHMTVLTRPRPENSVPKPPASACYKRMKAHLGFESISGLACCSLCLSVRASVSVTAALICPCRAPHC